MILEDYGNFRSKDPKAIVDLQCVLRGVAGSYGTFLSYKHPFFKGVNILQANLKFNSKTIG
jgi:hypothetical protein